MINHFNININSHHQSPIMVENRVGDDHEKNSTSPLNNTPIFNSNSNSLLKSNNTTTTNNDDNIQKMDAYNSFHLNQKFMDPPPSTPSPSSSSMSSSMSSSSPSSSSSLSSSPSLLMMDDEKQWNNLMSEIDRACRLLAISADPYNWNKTEVRKWLKHQQRLHQLTQPMFSELLNFFDMDGMSLCELTIEDFHQRICDSTTITTGSATVAESPSMQNLSWKCATILYNELIFWRNAITSHCIEPDLEFFDLDPQFEQSTINDHHHQHHPNPNFDQPQQQPPQHRHPARSLMNPYGPASPVSYGSGYQLQQQQPHQQQPQRNTNNQHQQMYHQQMVDGYQAPANQQQQSQQQMIHDLYNNNNNSNNNNNNPSLCNSVYSTPPSPAGSSHSSTTMMMSPNNNQPQPQSSVNHVAYSTDNNNNHHHHHNKFPYPNQQQPQPNVQNATCPGVHHHNGSGGYLYEPTFPNQSQQRIAINGGSGGGGSLMLHHHYQQTSDYGSDCYILSDDEMSDDSACETMTQIQDYLKSSDFPGMMMMKFNSSIPQPQTQPPSHKSSSSPNQQQISSLSNGIACVVGPHRTTQLASSNVRPHGSTSIQLWQFLKELLAQPQTYGTSIRWLERPKGVFKIEDSVRVAKLWGERKKRPAMNYDKLSRSIRQYYKKGIMKKTERAQRLVYQFCQPYSL